VCVPASVRAALWGALFPAPLCLVVLCGVVGGGGGGGGGGGYTRKRDRTHELMNCVQYMSESCLN